MPDKTIISLLNEIFAEYNNIFFPEIGKFRFYSNNFEKELVAIIERHPMRLQQILETFSSENLTKTNILLRLEKLESQEKIKKIEYNNQIFYGLSEK